MKIGGENMTENQEVKTQVKAPIIPKICENTIEINGSQWKIFYYEEFQTHLENNFEALAKKLSHQCQDDFNSHRVQLVVKGIPLLYGIFPDKKTIQTYSPRLGRELYLLEQIQQNREVSPCSELVKTKEYKDLMIYAEDVVSLHIHEFPSQYEITTRKYGLDDIVNDPYYEDLEKDIDAKVSTLVTQIKNYSPTYFEKFSDFGLDLTARYALLRIHLLKFVAILPSLDHDTNGTEVKRILLETFRRLVSDSTKARLLRRKGQEAPLPTWIVLCVRFLGHIGEYIPAKSLSHIVRTSVRFMARRFIAGENIESVEHSFKTLFESGRDVTLDQLGELVVSEKEADHYCKEVIKLIEGFGLHVKKGDKNKAGINKAHVSIKVSALCSDFKPHAPEYTYNMVAPRLKSILLKAKEKDVFINIDAEHYDYRDIVLHVYSRVLLETQELHDYKQTGIVLQAYLRDCYEHFVDIVELAKKRGLCMPIRLVKGAYWDAETVEADAHSFDAPEFLNKEETDLNFRQMVIKLMENSPHVQLCLASHNFADHCFAETLREQKFRDTPIIEHQCLHMTYEALSTAMAKMGWPTRNYVPVGSLLVGMAYLVRRIMENSSQVGVLTIMRSHNKKARMDSPMDVYRTNYDEWLQNHDLTVSSLTSEFFNVPPIRLYLKDDWNTVDTCYKKFREEGLNKLYENTFITSGEEHTVNSSSDPDIVVGKIKFATEDDAQKAVKTLADSYEKGTWSRQFWLSRSSCLLKAADIMLSRRNELSALISYEAGKAIDEAYADVDEAIDFLNFYAREERKITVHSDRMVSRGPIASITPWNFPIAIPTGMTCGPLVAGNSVVIKSAEQTPLVANEMVHILYEAGVPKDALIHLPGLGETVGASLVNNDEVAGYVFTGSKAVGQMISHSISSRFYKNKLWDIEFPVKAVTEMGGKNAIIVTANAELDETVDGILYSAFAHAGQKCSAASRIIVDNLVKDRLIERLAPAAQDIEVGKAFNFSSSVNPVISEEDYNRLRKQVIEAKEEAIKYGGKVVIDRSQDDLPGYCVGPAILDVPKNLGLDKSSYASTELFGPVIHIIGVDNLDEALEVFHTPDYALTGGVFSQSQDDIDYLTSKMECGNLYVNRSITGARVGIEPFGGFKLSGTGPKAGGKVYIPAFHIHRRSTEMKKTIQGEGGDYRVELCNRSGLSPQMRVERMSKALQIFDIHFGKFFNGIRGYERRLLSKFGKWIHKNSLHYITKDHTNRKIPGQMSYSNFVIQGEHALCVAGPEVPHISSFMQVCAALLMGTGVTVLCRNKESYHWWSGVLNYFSQAGISRENFNVYFPTEEAFKQVLKNPMVSYYIVDGDIEWVKFINSIVFDKSYKEQRIRQVFTPYDSFNPSDFKRLCGNYVWVRAFAVNTMRHGAPLNLDLDVDI